MFSNFLQHPVHPLTESWFSTYHRPENEPGWALSSLAFTLFDSRIPNYDGMDGQWTRLMYMDIPRVPDLLTTLCRRPTFHFLHGDGYDLVPFAEISALEGVKELTAINEYFKQKVHTENIRIFINEDANTAVCFVHRANTSICHGIMAFLPLLYPKYFREKPLSANEKMMLNYISIADLGGFMQTLGEILQPRLKEFLHTELKSCMESFNQAKLRDARQDVEMAQNHVEQSLENYKEYVERLNQAIQMYEGLRVTLTTDEKSTDELVDYIASEPRLHKVTFQNGVLLMTIDSLLVNVDPEKWKRLKAREDIFSGYALENDNPFSIRENRILFLDHLFGKDPQMRVHLMGGIKINLNTRSMDVQSHGRYDDMDSVLGNCMPNPHFELHSCPGQNRGQILECISRGDIETAIECCMAAVGSVNIDETELTFRPFVCSVMASEKKIIHMNDGRDLTPQAALLWLIAQQKTNTDDDVPGAIDISTIPEGVAS